MCVCPMSICVLRVFHQTAPDLESRSDLPVNATYDSVTVPVMSCGFCKFSLLSTHLWPIFTKHKTGTRYQIYKIKFTGKIKYKNILCLCCPNINNLSILTPISRWTWVSRCLMKQRMMEVMVTTGAVNRAKLQSNHHHQQTNTQFFYTPDALPVTQPTVSKHWRENITFHGVAVMRWSRSTQLLYIEPG